jgi:hypothetical protein
MEASYADETIQPHPNLLLACENKIKYSARTVWPEGILMRLSPVAEQRREK